MHIDVARTALHANNPVLFMPLHKRSTTIPGVRQVNSTRARNGIHTSQSSKKRAASPVGKAKTKPQRKQSQPKPATALKTHATVAAQKKGAPLSKKRVKAKPKQSQPKKSKNVKERVACQKISTKEPVVSPIEPMQPVVEHITEKVVPIPEEKPVVQELGTPDLQAHKTVNDAPAMSEVLSQLPPTDDTQPAIAGGGVEQAVYVGQVEWDALQVQTDIKHEIERHWRPPAGLSRDLVCQIKVVVTWEGAVDSLVVVQRSGVLAYDVHARATVAAMKFPKATWGKELIIHFKQ
jgi:hypothetical protein